MRKKYNTLAEEINRMKSLFTEERLYGNLVDKPLLTEANIARFLSKGFINSSGKFFKEVPTALGRRIAKAMHTPIFDFDGFAKHLNDFPKVWKVMLSDHEYNRAVSLIDQLGQWQQAGKLGEKTVIKEIPGKPDEIVSINIYERLGKDGYRFIDLIPESAGLKDMVMLKFFDETDIGPTSRHLPSSGEEVVPFGMSNKVSVISKNQDGNLTIKDGDKAKVLTDKDGNPIKDKTDTNGGGKTTDGGEYVEYEVVPDINKPGDYEIKIDGNTDIEAALKRFQEMQENMVSKNQKGHLEVLLDPKTGQYRFIFRTPTEGLTVSQVQDLLNNLLNKNIDNAVGESGSGFAKNAAATSRFKKWFYEKYTRHFINPVLWGEMKHRNVTGLKTQVDNNALAKQLRYKVPLRFLTITMSWGTLCGVMANIGIMLGMKNDDEEGAGSWSSACGNFLLSPIWTAEKLFTLFGLFNGVLSSAYCGVIDSVTGGVGPNKIKCKDFHKAIKKYTEKLRGMSQEDLLVEYGIDCEFIEEECTGSNGAVDEEAVKNMILAKHTENILKELGQEDANFLMKYMEKVVLEVQGSSVMKSADLQKLTVDIIDACYKADMGTGDPVVNEEGKIKVTWEEDPEMNGGDGNNDESGDGNNYPDYTPGRDTTKAESL